MKIRQHIILPALLLSLSLTACVTTSVKPRLDPEKQAKLAYIHYQLGIDALGKQGMLPKAFDELMQSDRLNPGQPYVQDALAYAWLLRGNTKESEIFYRKALRDGAGAVTYTNYANLLNRLQRFPEAESYARKALADPRYPNQDKAFINLGDALLGQHQADAAIKAYQQARQFNPDSTIISYKLAHAYYINGKMLQAQALYEIFIRQQPDYRPAVAELVDIFRQQNKREAARALLNRYSQQATSALDRAWAHSELDRQTGK